MRKLGFVLLVASSAFGCSDNDAPPVTPTANGVFPSHAFVGRKLRVEVSGDSTTWSSAATVSFGDGITVDTVTLSSPTDLFADITITSSAALGKRDVTVTDGGKSLTLAQAFQLDAPIAVKYQGNVAQGSVVVYTIVNHDIENPFDDTSAPDPNNPFAVIYPNISVSGPTGATFNVSSVTPFKVSGVALIDVDAAATGAIDVSSGAAGGDLVDYASSMAITARMPQTLTAGTAAQGNIAMPYDSILYQFEGSGTPPMLTHITATAQDSAAAPAVAVLGGQGHFATDFLGFAAKYNTIDTAAPGPLYVIYWDNTGDSGYSMAVLANSLGLKAANEGNDATNNAFAGALALMMPGLEDNATLSSATDMDWLKITVTAADITAGKHVHVITSGDPMTDTVVEVFGPNSGTTSLGKSDDLGYGEDFQTAKLTAAGTYYVKVSASPYFSAQHSAYNAAVFLD